MDISEEFLSLDSLEENVGNAQRQKIETEAKQTNNGLELPPWLSIPPDSSIPHLTTLHNEIIQFAKLVSPCEKDMVKRTEVFNLVKECAEGLFPGCQVLLFGSQATGLLLPGSDIDVVVLDSVQKEGEAATSATAATTTATTTTTTKEENYLDKALQISPMRRLANAIRTDWGDDLSYMEVVEHTRVPIVKLTHEPSGLSIDISFDMLGGPKAAELMKTFMMNMPMLKPLCFVLKFFLVSRGLNEPYSGGIGSFMLQLMVVGFLQQRYREDLNAKRPCVPNLGCLLLEFFELFGENYNYITTGISVLKDGSFFSKGADKRREAYFQPNRPFNLAIENPLEVDMDVGKASFKVGLVKRSFEFAHKTLLAHVSEPAVPAISILASVIPMSTQTWNEYLLKNTG